MVIPSTREVETAKEHIGAFKTLYWEFAHALECGERSGGPTIRFDMEMAKFDMCSGRLHQLRRAHGMIGQVDDSVEDGGADTTGATGTHDMHLVAVLDNRGATHGEKAFARRA